MQWPIHYVDCSRCMLSYLRMMQTVHIGMTTRHLVTRIQEHLHSTTNKTAISEHLKLCESCKKDSNVKSFKIIKKCSNEYETKIHEALQIKKINPKLNKQLYANGSSFLLNVFWLVWELFFGALSPASLRVLLVIVTFCHLFCRTASFCI